MPNNKTSTLPSFSTAFFSAAFSSLLLMASSTALAQEVQQPVPVEVNEAGPAEDFYYGDHLGEGELDEPAKVRSNGVIPATHTVRTGDTLWDLSDHYFHNAWHWPKVWGLNPEIADPHKIYPGNIVRLRKGGMVPTALHVGPSQASGRSAPRKVAAAPRPSASFGLQQMAYVDIEDLKQSAKVVGAVQDKELLSTGDSIYVSYEKGKPPRVGETYAIYKKGKSIQRGDKEVGAYVSVYGELKITYSKKGKQARAEITSSVRPVERGMRIGLLNSKFGEVEPLANTKQVEGQVADLIGPDQLIGAENAVIVDRGSKDGVEVGNRFLVLRSGDAFHQVMRPSTSVGQEDSSYPARAIGEVMIVQVGKQASLGVVTFSIHEFGVGDRVLMRKGK